MLHGMIQLSIMMIDNKTKSFWLMAVRLKFPLKGNICEPVSNHVASSHDYRFIYVTERGVVYKLTEESAL